MDVSAMKKRRPPQLVLAKVDYACTRQKVFFFCVFATKDEKPVLQLLLLLLAAYWDTGQGGRGNEDETGERRDSLCPCPFLSTEQLSCDRAAGPA